MFYRGFLPILWDEEYKNFDYVRQPITGEEADTWRKQGYTHDTTTGKMYDSRNPMPEWVDKVASLLTYSASEQSKVLSYETESESENSQTIPLVSSTVTCSFAPLFNPLTCKNTRYCG